MCKFLFCLTVIVNIPHLMKTELATHIAVDVFLHMSKVQDDILDAKH